MTNEPHGLTSLSEPLSPYLSSIVPLHEWPDTHQAGWFVGLDLAPNEGLETGWVVMDRQRRILQADKVITDAQILNQLASLGPPEQTVVAIDAPKSLSLDTRWQQERIRLYPFQMDSDTGLDASGNAKVIDRCAERVWWLADTLAERGYTSIVYLNAVAKFRLGLRTPYRTRTPQGCRALQATLREKLGLHNMPTTMVASAVLDGMVAAYMAWLVGTHHTDAVQLYYDEAKRFMAEPKEEH
ncbi:MAG: DUF429 domain-containing protein [Vampirovibrionales bacterium]|nr:DUF429 domain-containing protein [Vampirovibrionales bacterium]